MDEDGTDRYRCRRDTVAESGIYHRFTALSRSEGKAEGRPTVQDHTLLFNILIANSCLTGKDTEEFSYFFTSSGVT